MPLRHLVGESTAHSWCCDVFAAFRELPNQKFILLARSKKLPLANPVGPTPCQLCGQFYERPCKNAINESLTDSIFVYFRSSCNFTRNRMVSDSVLPKKIVREDLATPEFSERRWTCRYFRFYCPFQEIGINITCLGYYIHLYSPW